MLNWLAKYFKSINIAGVFGVEFREPSQQEISRSPKPPAVEIATCAPSSFEELIRSDPDVRRLLENANWKQAAESAIAQFLHGTECINENWPSSRTWAIIRKACLDHVIRLLGRYKQRASYGAVGALVGLLPRSVMSGRPKVHENSWVVGLEPPHIPSGYTAEQMDPELTNREGILSTVEELRAWLRSVKC